MSKGAKKSGVAKKAGGAKKAKKSGRKGKRSFATYIGRVNKNSKRGLTLSSRTVKILNSFAFDLFDRLATQAAALARLNKKATLGSREIQSAVRLQLPAELAAHSMSEASKAVSAASK